MGQITIQLFSCALPKAALRSEFRYIQPMGIDAQLVLFCISVIVSPKDLMPVHFQASLPESCNKHSATACGRHLFWLKLKAAQSPMVPTFLPVKILLHRPGRHPQLPSRLCLQAMAIILSIWSRQPVKVLQQLWL